jgi:hypothetical protein
MKRVSFVFPLFYGIAVFPMGLRYRHLRFFMGTDIHISFGFSFGFLPMRSLVLLRSSIWNKLSFLLFKKGCLRMSSILEICWSYSIQT